MYLCLRMPVCVSGARKSNTSLRLSVVVQASSKRESCAGGRGRSKPVSDWYRDDMAKPKRRTALRRAGSLLAVLKSFKRRWDRESATSSCAAVDAASDAVPAPTRTAEAAAVVAVVAVVVAAVMGADTCGVSATCLADTAPAGVW